jgi:DAK2 domain fusion protein YloV
VSELETARRLARGALAALEAARRRIDDLNVYPVPDGDTGTNMTLTARAVVEVLDASSADDRATLAHEATRAALLGARGNSGVILSQILRGAVEPLTAEAGAIDAALVARALRGASDAAYGAVREPVEGTMLTVARALAEDAERRAASVAEPGSLLEAVLAAGEEALARTPEQLQVLKQAGVVDAGGAGLLELVRGLLHVLTGAPLPAVEEQDELSIGAEAVHQELSRYRYCTTFVVEGEELDVAVIERELDALGDSLLVVGDPTALKVHVHTDEPGTALTVGTGRGAISGVEVADMHRQTAEREQRLTDALHLAEPKTTEAVAVVSGSGNARLFADVGAGVVVDGGRTMNPSTSDLLAAVESAEAPEVVLLPNNPNVVLSAEQAAAHASKPVRVVATDSLQAGLAALVAYDPSRSADENAGEMRDALDAVATGAVAVASRDTQLNGVAVRRGGYLGLVDGEAVSAGEAFDDVARSVVEQLLSQPRDVLTLLVGDEPPDVGALRAYVEEQHPEIELEVHEGGQPHYPLLLSAE